MSLNVSAVLLDRAEAGEVTDEQFLECVRDSLPYAWKVISQVAADASGGPGGFADHEIPPPGETERGQLLRALASDAIRGALERHFTVKLAFQNCHRVAAFGPSSAGGERYRASPGLAVRRPPGRRGRPAFALPPRDRRAPPGPPGARLGGRHQRDHR